MGYYIETAGHLRNKAKIIVEIHNGEIIEEPKNFNDIPANKAIICVVDNGPFEAAGYCYSEEEFKAFTDMSDPRRKVWLLIDKDKAERLTGKK